MTFSRRAFLRLLATLFPGAAGLLAGCDSGEETPGPGGSGIVPVAFEEALPSSARPTLERALERILPSDDGPGAAEAGVIDYVLRALGEAPWASARGRLLAGLRVLDQLATRDWGVADYGALEPEGADRVLEFVQAGSADVEGADGAEFVHDLVVLALEGFLGDPVHGGNSGCRGWRYIGYEPGDPRPGSCGHTEGE